MTAPYATAMVGGCVEPSPSYNRRVGHFIRPGKPTETAFIESFNSRLREECLNANWFDSLDHARELIAAWWTDYNHDRPYSALGGLTPVEYEEMIRTRPPV